LTGCKTEGFIEEKDPSSGLVVAIISPPEANFTKRGQDGSPLGMDKPPLTGIPLTHEMIVVAFQ